MSIDPRDVRSDYRTIEARWPDAALALFTPTAVLYLAAVQAMS